ncbi:MAG: helix-turn-helix domain-containing protein [Treponema sp.]|jgi:DNA-binding LacI/PurR family transcriptional regulator/AraC-like DNA-binding protein|nr:helix-turn-helix domain-containing protein [Treponema sp.]
MSFGKKRIGLALASIYTGASLNVWSSFARMADAAGTALFIFPGGRLNARTDAEYLRNAVYALVNEENLDGLISWSSTIRCTESTEEFEHFHARFEPLPYVTMSYKVPGHPCVEFDAYNGMKALVTHCIHVHGARRIAFLRGPDFHQSAVARFKGYQDALKEAGLPASFGNPLVTDPFNWDCGDAAAAQLFEKRGLVPGRDFDTLIGSSDMMVFRGAHYLLKQGYHIPIDYRAGGFNNSGESRLLESPLSTVHMPYTELSAECFSILLKLLNRKRHASARKTGEPWNTIEDVVLGSELIIRESCGCRHSLRSKRKPLAPGSGTEESVAMILEMVAERLKLKPAGIQALVFPVVHAFFYQGEERFFYLFEKALSRFFHSDRDIEILIRLIGDVFAAGLFPELSRVESSVYETIFRIQERLATHRRYERERWNTALNSLKCELLGTRNRDALVRSLAGHLPELGITTTAIMLYDDEKISVCVGSFSPAGIDPRREQRFPARLLVPAYLKPQYADGVFMVQPLFIENQSLGYFIHNVPFADGVIFEELRSAVSYALKGISLLEAVIRAKGIAEQAERAKTEFLQVLENELYDPFAGVMETLEGLERDDVGAADIRRLKALIASRETEAGSLIDLTLSRINELSLHKTLFEPDELLPGIGVFPLLTGDVSRLSQCFALIREEYDGAVSAGLRRGGLSISFVAGSPREEHRGKRHLLAERIILLHGGEFHQDVAECTMLLPWPTLTGQEPARQPGCSQDHVLVLSDPSLLPANFFDLPILQDIEKAAALPGRTSFIVWNTDAASLEDFIRIAALRHRPEFFTLPFLCYGKGLSRSSFTGSTGAPLSGKTLIDAIEKVIQVPSQGTILMVGMPSARYQSWSNIGDVIHIPAMTAFNETVTELTPSMVVLNSLNTEAVEAIRRHPLTVMVPLVLVCERIESAADVLNICRYSRLLLCHRAVASSPEFTGRIKALLGGEEMLPPHTGALVKKALLYFNLHAESHISRWKLAEAVHVSEDYLTRIFHLEMGLSLWDYLNRYRIFLAADLLRQTDDSIQEIALRSGFQNQAYFCRVFKKIYGLPPSQVRKKPE